MPLIFGRSRTSFVDVDGRFFLFKLAILKDTNSAISDSIEDRLHLLSSLLFQINTVADVLESFWNLFHRSNYLCKNSITAAMFKCIYSELIKTYYTCTYLTTGEKSRLVIRPKSDLLLS